MAFQMIREQITLQSVVDRVCRGDECSAYPMTGKVTSLVDMMVVANKERAMTALTANFKKPAAL